MKTMTVALVGLALLSTPADAAKRRPAPPPPPVVVPFSATAAFGETVPILTHGPMTLLLHCFRDALGDIARLAVVSTESDMLITGERSILMPAGDDATLLYGAVASPDGGGYVSADPRPSHFYDGGASGGSAITPSGWVLSVPDSVGFGVGVSRFSATPHGWEAGPDCFVTGSALLTRATVLPAE
jgi:hypothetical protein